MPQKSPDLSSTLKKLFEHSSGPRRNAPETLFQTSAQAPAADPSGSPSASQAVMNPQAPEGPKTLVDRLTQRFTGLLKRYSQERKIVGVDLGSGSVKLVQMRSEGGEIRMTGCSLEELPSGLTEGPDWEKAVQDVLQRAKKQGLLQGALVTGFYHFDAVVEVIRLSKMPRSELEQAVVWEVKERLGVDPQRTVIRFVVTGEVAVEGQPQMDILVVAAPKQALMDQWHLLSGLGFRVTAMEPANLAHFYALARANLWKSSEVVGVLEIGFKFSHLCFVRGDAVRFARSFPVAGESFTRAIADYCRITYEEAEKVKLLYGMSQMALEEDRLQTGHEAEDRVRASHALGLFMEKLVAEIEQSYRYFAFELGGTESQKMDRLLITGGGGLLKNLPEFLSIRLSVPVLLANPLRMSESDPAAVRSLPQPEWSHRLAVPLGLALRLGK